MAFFQRKSAKIGRFYIKSGEKNENLAISQKKITKNGEKKQNTYKNAIFFQIFFTKKHNKKSTFLNTKKNAPKNQFFMQKKKKKNPNILKKPQNSQKKTLKSSKKTPKNSQKTIKNPPKRLKKRTFCSLDGQMDRLQVPISRRDLR
jgi:hypothetical protein